MLVFFDFLINSEEYMRLATNNNNKRNTGKNLVNTTSIIIDKAPLERNKCNLTKYKIQRLRMLLESLRYGDKELTVCNKEK